MPREVNGRRFPFRRMATCDRDVASGARVIVLVFAVIAGILPPGLLAIQSGTAVSPRSTQSNGTPDNAAQATVDKAVPDENANFRGRASLDDAADPSTAEPGSSDAKVNDGISDGSADLESESTSQVSPAELAQLLPALDWMEDGVETDLDALFQQRMRLYGRCLQQWVQRQADLQPRQSRLLAAELDQIVDNLVPMRPQFETFAGDAYLPILFMQLVAPRIDAVLDPDRLPALELSDLQREQLATALQVRQQRLKRDNLEGVLFRVDSELLLTSRQSDLLAQVAANEFDLADSAFAFLADGPFRGYLAGYYPEQDLEILLRHDRLHGELSAHQLNVLADLVSTDRRFPVNVGALRQGEPGLLQSQADYIFRVQRSIVGAQVDCLRGAVSVGDQTALQVQMTAARLVDGQLEKWQRQQQASCLRHADVLSRKDSEFISPRAPSRLLAFELAEFTAALDAIAGGRQVRRQRDAKLKLQLTHYMRGLLDQELWLTSSQRETLCVPLSASIQQSWLAPSPDDDVADQWAWGGMAVSLHSVPDRTLQALSRHQALALIGLRRLFIPDRDEFQVSLIRGQHVTWLGSRFSPPSK